MSNNQDIPEEESEAPETSSEEIKYTKLQGLGMICAATIFGVMFLSSEDSPDIGAALGALASTTNFYNCGEPVSLSRCEKNTWGDCLFTNNAKVSVNPANYQTWNYDANGIFMSHGMIYSNINVAPEQTVHMEYQVVDRVHDSVFCSVDPNGSIVGGKSNWKTIQ